MWQTGVTGKNLRATAWSVLRIEHPLLSSVTMWEVPRPSYGGEGYESRQILDIRVRALAMPVTPSRGSSRQDITVTHADDSPHTELCPCVFDNWPWVDRAIFCAAAGETLRCLHKTQMMCGMALGWDKRRLFGRMMRQTKPELPVLIKFTSLYNYMWVGMCVCAYILSNNSYA